jgi:cytochrome c
MKAIRSYVAAAGVVIFALVGQMNASLAQDATAGEQIFVKCRICHQIGPGAQNLIGPDLNGVVGRKAGTQPGFDYSDALKASGLTWDQPTLEKWLKAPNTLVPGTKMTFAGLNSDRQIANVIAYLSQFKADGSEK